MSFFDSIVDGVFDLASSVGGMAVSAADYVVDNPGKTALVCVGAIATGGLASAFAAPLAAMVGSTGLLGATASGTAISSLSGAALANASLAALGGGSLAAGGGGMVAGATVVATAGTAVGATVGVGAASLT